MAITHCAQDGIDNGLLLYLQNGQVKRFSCERRDEVIDAMRESLQKSLGFALFVEEVDTAEYDAIRAQLARAPKLLASSTVSRGKHMESRVLGISSDSVVELDADTRRVIVTRPVQDIFSIIRCNSNDYEFILEMKQGGNVLLSSPQRDVVLGNILDIATLVGCELMITPESLGPLKIGPRHTPPDVSNEDTYVKRILSARDAATLLSAIQQFNVNLPTQGLQTKDKKLLARVLELFRACSNEPSSRVATLQCVQRLMSSRALFDELGRSAESVASIVEVMRAGSDMYVCVCVGITCSYVSHFTRESYAAANVLRALVRQPLLKSNDKHEIANRTMLCTDSR